MLTLYIHLYIVKLPIILNSIVHTHTNCNTSPNLSHNCMHYIEWSQFNVSMSEWACCLYNSSIIVMLEKDMTSLQGIICVLACTQLAICRHFVIIMLVLVVVMNNDNNVNARVILFWCLAVMDYRESTSLFDECSLCAKQPLNSRQYQLR